MVNAKTMNDKLRGAILKGDTDLAEIILMAGADPNFVNNSTPVIILAAQKNNYELVELLIDEYEADPNLNDAKDSLTSALTWAVANDNMHMAEYLLSNGADPYEGEVKAVENGREKVLYGTYEYIKYYNIDPKFKRLLDMYR